VLFYLSSFIFLQTISVFPVFESIFVVTGTHAQVTVLAFSSFTTTQCWINSADAGGIALFSGFTCGATGGGGGGGAVTTAGFFGEQAESNKTDTSQNFFITEWFAF
jgi:hypothetical protein